jgi:hypothetical protein
MRIATGEIEEGAGAPLDDGKDPLRSLGRKGGEARAAGMTAKRRKEIAKKAAAKSGEMMAVSKRRSFGTVRFTSPATVCSERS